MDHRALLTDAARRPLDAAERVLAGISDETLHAMPGGRGNSIAWLVWHAARQQDAQMAPLLGADEVWRAGDWARRLGVDRDPGDHGFGDGAGQVRALHVDDPAQLLAYLAAVVASVVDHVAGLSATDLDDVVDTAWDPPVTRGVRIVSTIDDAIAHVGQAAYVRGLVEGWSIGY